MLRRRTKTRRSVRGLRRAIESLEQRALLTAGLTAVGNQYWHQDLTQIDDPGENLDDFGRAVMTGDFNADKFQDLAIGVPGESAEGLSEAGAVNVLYGASGGLTLLGSQIWNQGSTDILSDLEAGDRFGSALAVGDFNGDKVDDLAVGVPRDSIDGFSEAGGVNVIYGSPSFGLTSRNNQFWSQRETLSDLEAGDRFGQALAVGDFNRDGFDDLAVGAPRDSINSVAGAGGVNVIYGSTGGLTTVGNQFWSQESVDILGDAGVNDGFGTSLAVNDFNRDGYGDLAIGVPGDTVDGQIGAGAVNVIFGSVDGLTAFSNQLWHRGVDGILGDNRGGNQFGEALAAGDFDRDGLGDLAIGVPGDRVSGVTNAGGVNVMYGTTLSGLTVIGNQLWQQNNVVVGVPLANSRFGRSLAAGNFDASLPPADDDLAIGGTGANDAGLVNVLYGTTDGLRNTDAQVWQQGTLDDGEVVQGLAQPNEEFGASLAAGDFDNNGLADLAIGVPRDLVENVSDRIGAVNVLYGFDIASAPVAIDDTSSTTVGVAVIINVLENDRDPDGTLDVTTVTVVAAPSNGSASPNPTTGQVTYTPNAGFSGTDEFTYTVRDNDGQLSNVASVNIAVTIPNMKPVAQDDDARTNEDQIVIIDVLDNDSDADGELLPSTVTIIDDPESGLATVNQSTGEITYMPQRNFSGLDTLQYTVEDDDGAISDPATVRITVDPVNDPPSALPNQVSTLMNEAVRIDVLANDTDVDGVIDPTTVAITRQPTSGSAVPDAITGEIVYTPNAGFTGVDELLYTVKDDLGAVSNPTLVRVVVDELIPVARDDAASTGKSALVAIDVLANDGGSLDATSVTVTDDPDHGEASVDALTGEIRYTPDAGFVGIDRLRYRVRSDNDLESQEATVTVTVAGWLNPPNPLDVDNDGTVAPIDALLIINEINSPTIIDETGRISLATKDPADDFLDVDGDNFVVPFDALLVINFLNRGAANPAVPAVAALGAAVLEQQDNSAAEARAEPSAAVPLSFDDKPREDFRMIDAFFDQHHERRDRPWDWNLAEFAADRSTTRSDDELISCLRRRADHRR